MSREKETVSALLKTFPSALKNTDYSAVTLTEAVTAIARQMIIKMFEGDYTYCRALRGLVQSGNANNDELSRIFFDYKKNAQKVVDTYEQKSSSKGEQEASHIKALTFLGVCHQGGFFQDTDYKLAIQFYERAIALGSPVAINNRALMQALPEFPWR